MIEPNALDLAESFQKLILLPLLQINSASGVVKHSQMISAYAGLIRGPQ